MEQHARALERHIVKTLRLSYLLALPEGSDADDGAGWPLVLFLHGGGERGDDLEQVKKHGLPRLIAAGQRFPFITVSPQCPLQTAWPLLIDELDSLLDEVAADQPVDPDRVYVTGMSMGGYGTWHLAAAYPDRFAALAPICGGGHWFAGFPSRVAVLRHVPIWAFHGGLDEVVPPAESGRLVEVLRAHDGQVRLTVYPDVGHDAWTPTYANPDLYEWLLARRRDRAMSTEP